MAKFGKGDSANIIQQILEAAPEWGWRIEETKKGWMLYPEDKTLGPVAIHSTLSDKRGVKNMISRLRKRGAPI